MSDNTAPVLIGSSRRIPKATYVPLKVEGPPPEQGRAIEKFGFVARLGLQPGEVDAVRKTLAQSDRSRGLQRTLKILTAFEGSPLPSQLPSPGVFTTIPASLLKTFGTAIVNLRQRAMQAVRAAGPATPMDLIRYNAAVVARNAFEANIAATPIGMLNLERLVVTPVGIQRGELLATIPLAPLERTAVVHKEWSVTTKEFTSIVTDSLENYSETGVTDNTELAQSTTSQISHNNQFNISATVSGGFGPVTATVASSFGAQNQASSSAVESRKHAIATTRKASARAKQEHKVTISTTTVTGTSETSTRVLENTSPTNPMRIDYFSIMRKWHVGLYRYGLRLTYDVAIPEPGATLRRLYAQLDDLKSKIGPFTFTVTHDEIKPDNNHYKDLADQHQAVVPPPPASVPPMRPNMQANAGSGWHFNHLDFEVPQDYRITNVHVFSDQGGIADHGNIRLVVEGTQPLFVRDTPNAGGTVDEDIPGFLHGETGPQSVYFNLVDAAQAFFELDIALEPTPQSIQKWQSDVWSALYDAAQAQYAARQQDIQAQIAALEDQINNVDTLTLRREENEEIMKGVLRWLLGPTFHFMPNDVLSQYQNAAKGPQATVDLAHGAITDSGDGLAVTANGWLPMLMYEEMVKFINEAIEWENVLYFLYSYFWDVPPSWSFIRQIKHPDPTRQAFLRAGSARVVLTVRKGWEEAWVRFVEAGGFDETLIPKHPYLTIAQEIHDYDETNYPGIPPANPGGGPLPDNGESVATVSSDVLPPGAGPVTINVKSSDGFVVGYTAILDTWDNKNPKDPTATLQETQTITAVDVKTNTITVDRIDNPHDGSKKPFTVMQAGEKGQLIAEWFEYTPTSGTDIAVTSDLATIS